MHELPPTAAPLLIGEWRFSPDSYEIERDGVRLRLPRRIGAVLARLAADAGRVVSREDLIADVWERRGVTHDVLSRTVAELREALGDDARTPRYVETIPKSGYRLNAAVRPASAVPALAPAPDGAVRQSKPGTRAWSPPALAAIGALLLSGLIAWAVLRRDPAPPPSPGPGPAQVELDLAGERPLTSGAGRELGPTVSPDGRLVAFAEVLPGADASVIVVQALDGSARRLFDDEPVGWNTRPAFSPDGNRILFRQAIGDGCELRLRPVLSGQSRRLAQCAPDTGAMDWSADGRTIVYNAPAAAGRAPGLSLLDVESGASVALTRPEAAQGPDLDPRFVPGTRRVSFARGVVGDQSLAWLDLDAPENIELLVPGDNLIHGHAWTPDGGTLVVATDSPGYRALVAIDDPGGPARVLGARGARYPVIASSGLMVYELANYDANIWRVELAGSDAGAVRKVVGSTRYDASPVISPDMTQFVYVSTRDGMESVWLADASGAGERKLPLSPERRWVRPHWSPDGGSLLLTAYLGSDTQVFRHDLASGRTVALELLGPDPFGAEHEGGSGGLVFGRARGGALDLYRAAGDDDPRPLALADARGVVEFHVGDGFVAYTRPAQAGIMLLSLADGTTRGPVLGQVGPQSRFNWIVRGAAIFFVHRADDAAPPRMYRYDTVDGSTKALQPAGPSAVAPAISVAADESWALFASTDSLTVDLMAVPLRGLPAAAR